MLSLPSCPPPPIPSPPYSPSLHFSFIPPPPFPPFQSTCCSFLFALLALFLSFPCFYPGMPGARTLKLILSQLSRHLEQRHESVLWLHASVFSIVSADLQSTFLRVDADRNGWISREEFGEVFKLFNFAVSPEVCQAPPASIFVLTQFVLPVPVLFRKNGNYSVLFME